MRIVEILPNVLHVDFERPWIMSKFLGRMQEHTEHPKFYKTIFSTSRIKKYYGNYKYGFRRSALGYNIPSWAFEPFWRGDFKTTQSEKDMLQALTDLGYKQGGSPFYIIASADGSALNPSEHALDHEIAHALWYVDASYKEAVLTLMHQHPEYVEKVRKQISQWSMYTPAVYEDECHAYLTTDSFSCLQERFLLDKNVEPLRNALNAILQIYKERYAKAS